MDNFRRIVLHTGRDYSRDVVQYLDIEFLSSPHFLSDGTTSLFSPTDTKESGSCRLGWIERDSELDIQGRYQHLMLDEGFQY